MSIYKCDKCDYNTNKKSNLSRHFTTHNKRSKVNQQMHTTCIPPVSNIDNLHMIHESFPNDSSNEKFRCQYCNNFYSSAANLARHKKACEDKSKLENEYDIKLKQLTDQFVNQLNESNFKLSESNKLINQKEEMIDILKSENAYLKSIVNNSGSMIKTSLSTMAYVLKHYKDAPVLESPKDYSAIHYEQDNTEFIENLIYEHNNNKLHIYISDFIIKTYKTDDPTKRSFWNSDTSRLTYLIREIITNNKVDWRVDKKGIKITKFVIEPILEYIENLVREYVQNFKVNRNHSAKEAEKIMMKMKSGNDILNSIETKILSEEILKYITPHFYIIKNDELIEE